jgi:hypothetical protein
MALSSNPAVTKAYKAGTYTDARGVSWRRGMDGWFSDYRDGVCLCYHHDMVAMIEKENPI